MLVSQIALKGKMCEYMYSNRLKNANEKIGNSGKATIDMPCRGWSNAEHADRKADMLSALP